MEDFLKGSIVIAFLLSLFILCLVCPTIYIWDLLPIIILNKIIYNTGLVLGITCVIFMFASLED